MELNRILAAAWQLQARDLSSTHHDEFAWP